MSFGGTNYLALFMVLIIFLSFTLISYYRPLWQRAVLFAMMGSAGYISSRPTLAEHPSG